MSSKVTLAFTQHLHGEEVEYEVSGDCKPYESTCDVDNLGRTRLYVEVECAHTPGSAGDWTTPGSDHETDYTLTFAAIYGLGGEIILRDADKNGIHPSIEAGFIKAAKEQFMRLTLLSYADKHQSWLEAA